MSSPQIAPPPTDYNPLSKTPYTAPQLPEITPPPTRPQQETQQPNVAPTGPQVARSGGGLATVAFGLDSILKGYMRGKEQAAQTGYYKAKRLADGQRYAYEDAAQRYIGLVQSGTASPEEIQKADLAQRAAYAAWYGTIGNYMGMNGPQKSKKSKGGGQSSGTSGGASGDQQDPLQMIASQDPKVKAQGIYLLGQKVAQTKGTPANIQAMQYQTPEYLAQRKLFQGQQAIVGSEQQVEANKAALLKELTDLDKLPSLNPEQQKRQTELRENPVLFPSATRTPHYGTFDIPGESLAGKTDVWGNPIDPKKTYREVTRGTGEVGYEPSTVKSGSGAKPSTEEGFVESVAAMNGIRPQDLSPQSRLDLHHAWLQSAQIGKTVGQNYVYTDKETGQVVVVPLTHSTSVQSARVPGVSSISGTGAGGGPSAPSHSGAGAGAGTGTHKPGASATPASAASATSDNVPPPGSPAGAHVIGHTLSQPKAKTQATVNDTYKKMKPLFGLLDAQTQYMNEIKSDPSKATPRQDLSLVVAAVRAMNPGSVRLPQKELELEMKAGSYGDQASRWFEKASTGLLPDDQRNDLFHIVQRETTKAGESIAGDWQQYMSGQPLPEDIKRFAKAGAGAGAGGGAGASAPHAVDKILDDIFKPAPKPQ